MHSDKDKQKKSPRSIVEQIIGRGSTSEKHVEPFAALMQDEESTNDSLKKQFDDTTEDSQ